MTEIGLHSVVSRSEDEISVEVNGAYVLMNAQANEFYDMNSTATAVWERIADPVAVADLCTELARDFPVTLEVCQAEVIKLLSDLAERRMVTST